MGCALHKRAPVVGDGNTSARTQPIERGLHAQQIIVEPRPPLSGATQNLALRQQILIKRLLLSRAHKRSTPKHILFAAFTHGNKSQSVSALGVSAFPA